MIDVREVHPEVSFAKLLGRPARAPKKTWAGMEERRRALADVGILLHDLGEDGAAAATDDVLDAAAAAWSAKRVLENQAVSIPAEPELDPFTGRAMAIWA